ncbi:putative gamma-glutamylcyclotransferase At3g02910 [Chenopodium quinoa]|uniref:putative gamma-glutamylcyclotransferase At3g02910 n=1 Tax=Chenopodium quinoa TaxID=63459 RepID=UPI000B76ED5C|nr:putative gamma-glutamylcyclotransferase At3g02910 [Chenopodium quinoa]
MGADNNNNNGVKSGKRRLIFTYGTLKKGFSNHRLMVELMAAGDSTYIGPFRTAEKYPLVCGPYRVPFLLNLPGKGDMVWGEVYSVSETGLARLDELEGVSRGHYQRLPVEIAGLPDIDLGTAEAYYADESYAQEMWKRNGEAGFVSYSHKEAKGYVKRQDRPQNVSFLQHISRFLSSSPTNNNNSC